MKAAQRTFDRLIEFDRRSREFPIRALFGAGIERRSYLWDCYAFLNQGREGACAGFAVAHEAAAQPVVVMGITNAVARQVYLEAKRLDNIRGEDYEGTTILGAAKAAQARGWWGEYRWAFGVDDLALAIGWQGPAVIGVNWHHGMVQPDALGNIHATGPVQGGHAIMVRGYSKVTRRFRLHNSWGRAWGHNGECFLSEQDMRYLLSCQGEACIPLKRHG